MSSVMRCGTKRWAGDEQERAWEEGHGPARMTTEQRGDSITSLGIRIGSAGDQSSARLRSVHSPFYEL
jgi:hypothetical protein